MYFVVVENHTSEVMGTSGILANFKIQMITKRPQNPNIYIQLSP